MLSGEKLKELERLVGKPVADKFVSQLETKEQRMKQSDVAFKESPPVDPNITALVAAMLSEIAKKEAPPVDAKPMAVEVVSQAPAEMEDKDGHMEGEMEDTPSMLSPKDLALVAEAVATRLMQKMDEFKGMLDGIDEELKTRGLSRMKGVDNEVVSALKDFTNSHETFGDELIKAIEKLDTRVKAMETRVGTGHSPSESNYNVIGRKEHNQKSHLSPAEQSAYDFWDNLK